MKTKQEICEKCQETIDKSECGKAFMVFTIQDDRANDPEKYKQIRGYLCDGCSNDFQLWVLDQ